MLCSVYILISTESNTSTCPIYNSRQKSLGHLEETYKKPLSSTYCHSCYKYAPPFPLEQCWFACETLEVGVHAKFSHYCRYFTRKPTLFQGERGMKVRCRIQKVQSVPGLLSGIVDLLVPFSSKCILVSYLPLSILIP